MRQNNFMPFKVGRQITIILINSRTTTSHTFLIRQSTNIRLRAMIVPQANLTDRNRFKYYLATFTRRISHTTKTTNTLRRAQNTARRFRTIRRGRILNNPITRHMNIAQSQRAIMLPIVSLRATQQRSRTSTRTLHTSRANNFINHILRVSSTLVVRLLTNSRHRQLQGFPRNIDTLTGNRNIQNMQIQAFDNNTNLLHTSNHNTRFRTLDQNTTRRRRHITFGTMISTHTTRRLTSHHFTTRLTTSLYATRTNRVINIMSRLLVNLHTGYLRHLQRQLNEGVRARFFNASLYTR